MKYRVTTRGWIVFSILGLILIFSVASLIRQLSSPVEDAIDNVRNDETVIEETTDINDISSDNNENNSNEEETSEESNENVDSSDDTSDSQIEDSQESDEIEEETDAEVIEEEPIDYEMKSNILFDKNVSELKKENYSTLSEWAKLLLKHQELHVVVEGHVNGYPYYEDREFAKELSKARAEVVKQYLVDLGVLETQIEILIIGSKDQVEKNDEIEKHYLNRRAVIYIKKP